MNILDLNFIEKAKGIFPDYFSGKKVLELGALDVNGNVRGPFEGCSFTGVDWVAGKNVDIVMKGAEIEVPPESFDVLLSANHLEHDPEWEATLTTGLKALKRGGLILLRWGTRRSAAHGPEFDPHGKQGYYPKDVPEVVEYLERVGCTVHEAYCDQNPYIGIMGNAIAVKP